MVQSVSRWQFSSTRGPSSSERLNAPSAGEASPAESKRVATAELGQPDLLLSACVSGDSAAWRELHRRYHPAAAAFLRKLGVEGRELEDACQEVFVQLHRSLPQFRGECRFETWLYRLCVTQARRTRQRSRLARLVHELLSREPHRAVGTGPSLEALGARARVSAALGQLTPACREAFVLCEMEGLEGRQAAEVLRCGLPALWRRLHDARAQFRRALHAQAHTDGCGVPVVSVEAPP